MTPKLTKAIGIISYMPDDVELRAVRFGRLLKLLGECDRLFHNIPVIIIAQCWGETDISSENYHIYRYEKLGIPGARAALRERFLELGYDYLIMLDDDCELSGTSAANYLWQIDRHPGEFGIFRGSLLKLFAISREIYSKVTFPDVDVEKKQGYEDAVFVYALKELFPQNYFVFIPQPDHLNEVSDPHFDKFSTWHWEKLEEERWILSNANMKAKKDYLALMKYKLGIK